MASDNEVFFIDSSASDDEEGRDAQVPRRSPAHLTDGNSSSVTTDSTSAFPAAPTLAYTANSYRAMTASPSMEDVLFGLAPPKLRTPQTPASPVHGQANYALPTSSVNDVNGAAESPSSPTHSSTTVVHNYNDGAASSSAAGGAVGEAQRTHLREADFPYAGGSPDAMPAKQLPPPPRTLSELRGMTSSDVRDELERFFVRKDALSKRFKAVEAEMRAKTTDDGTPHSTLPTAEVLAWDRCRRLINVSNWDSAVNGYSQWDVLLPSSLLPSAVATTTTASAAPAARGDAVVPRRTLRPHQIEGIRFLWSVLAEGPVGQVPAVGCILAHTMGLGKTGQVVVFLHLFLATIQRRAEAAQLATSTGSNTASRPSSPLPSLTAFSSSSSSAETSARLPRVLIVIPKSTQSGWKREFATWSRCFPEACRLHPLSIEENLRPPQRVDMFHKWRREGGVLLIGYEALVRLMQLVEEDSVLRQKRSSGDVSSSPTTSPQPEGSPAAAREQYRHEMRARRTDEGAKAYGGDADPFTELVVCDEAHRLKSVHLQVVQALRGLHPLRRMLLTGTPLQNHLHEYWAMMDFCVHKYFSRRRFREYFIQPIEASANTRASEREVDLARKKTFTLINEVRHFVQRVDSTPLRNELPPLHEYVVVVPPSQLQKELYLRFIQIVQHDGTQKLQFLPAVSYSGKIAAHPQLLFQMHDALAEAKQTNAGNARGGRGTAQRGRPVSSRKRVSDYWEQERKNRQLRKAEEAQLSAQQQPMKRARVAEAVGGRQDGGTDSRRGESSNADGTPQNGADTNNSSDADDDDDDDEDSAVVISDSEEDDDDEEVKAEAKAEAQEKEFARVTQQSFSSLYPAPLTYEELCVPPSPTYVPRLEEGAKLHVAMKLIAAAIMQNEKVLLFSLSTQLLTFFEFLIAKVNVEWVKSAAPAEPPLLPRPIRYCRLDGSHTAAQRAAMLDEFDRAEGPDLFLLSMKAGGVGVTITAATRVILVDTSFNPADDQQAIGRAYRYGQTRPVFVYRLMCYPTLEYSIFVQKLAKEWLFKTVVEESSVKRDGLSGMHLKELFSLLTRAAKVLEKPPTTTRAQTQTTREVLSDDPMLTCVRSDLLYAQRYEMFLENDNNDQYGEEEEEFYKDYCRSRLFDGADDEDGEQRRAAELLARRQQRMDDAAQLQSQSKTLTSMVDDLIRSRSDTDPHLARLLTAMGLRVDAQSGRVETDRLLRSRWNNRVEDQDRAPAMLEKTKERFAPSPVVMVGGAIPTPPAVTNPLPPAWRTRSPGLHNSHQTAVLLLDSDDEVEEGVNSAEASAPPVPSPDHQQQQQQGGGDARSAVDSRNGHAPASSADQIAASLSRQPYAKYRPGASASRAVEIDSEGSQ